MVSFVKSGQLSAVEEEPLKIERTSKRGHGSGGFKIEIMFPGLARKSRDSGLGTIGRIDDASIVPGTLVAMHPHQDDEILTYLRRGRVMHKDTVGDVEWFSPTRLMLMGAGRQFQHEELVDPNGDNLRALQIFLRPNSAGLEPQVQFHDFGNPTSEGKWRLIAGPTKNDPLQVRSETWVEDGRFERGLTVSLPQSKVVSQTRLLYVFDGQIAVGQLILLSGDAAILPVSLNSLSTVTDSDRACL